MITEKALKKLVEDYEQEYEDKCIDKNWIDYVKKQSNLKDAIKIAVLSRTETKKKNSHQRRRKNEMLDEFSEKLANFSFDIEESTNFEDILSVVTKNKIKGIGVLARYDISYRIGQYLNIEPEKIYLYAGAKEGAEKLTGSKINKHIIEKKDLPKPLANSSLSCAHIEAFLCSKKNNF